MEYILLIGWFIWFFIGYFIGKGKMSTDTIQQAQKQIEKKLHPTDERVGVLHRPTAKEIFRRTNPDKDAEDEMEKTLGAFPELNQEKLKV